MKLTTLQIGALEYKYKKQMNIVLSPERHQKRIFKDLIKKGLLNNFYCVTELGIETLKTVRPNLFQTSNLVGREVFEQINHFEPIDLIVQRHIDNMINTYGQEQVMRYIELRKVS